MVGQYQYRPALHDRLHRTVFKDLPATDECQELWPARQLVQEIAQNNSLVVEASSRPKAANQLSEEVHKVA